MQLNFGNICAHTHLKKSVITEENGVMLAFPDSTWVRGYVLNHLEKGPERVADMIRLGANEFGFTAQEIREAGHHFAVTAQIVDGELFWTRPQNLFAIWWGRRFCELQAEHLAEQSKPAPQSSFLWEAEEASKRNCPSVDAR